MGRARVERHLQEYRPTGVVTVRASVLKGVASMMGMTLLAALGRFGYEVSARRGGRDRPTEDPHGFRDLPSGFAMSPKDLAVLMEVIRAGQTWAAE